MNTNDEPLFQNVRNDDVVFQKTIIDARSTVPNFKDALKNLSNDTYSCVKIYLPESPDSERGAYIWLANPEFEDGFCYAQLFELPTEFSWIKVGEWIKFREQEIIDWYLLSHAGDLRGGYSLRYQRARLGEEQKLEFDRRIGVKTYL